MCQAVGTARPMSLKQDCVLCVWRTKGGQCGCNSVSNGISGRKGGGRGSQEPDHWELEGHGLYFKFYLKCGGKQRED